MNKEQLLELAKSLMKIEYGKYLVKVSNEIDEDEFELAR